MLLFLISFLVLSDFGVGLLAAFCLGMVRDLWEARVLGESSFKFLILALIVNLYKRKFRAESFFYLLPFTFLVFLIWDMRLMSLMSLMRLMEESLKNTFLIIPVFFISSRMWYKILGEKGRVKV